MTSTLKQAKTVTSPDGKQIVIGDREYKEYLNDGYVHHYGKLRKGAICPKSGKFVAENTKGYVNIAGTNEFIKEDSKKFKLLCEDHFFDRENRMLTKVATPLQEDEVLDPQSGRAIKKGSNRFIQLHRFEYMYNTAKGKFHQARPMTNEERSDGKSINPKTGRVIARFSKAYLELSNSQDFQYREEVNGFIPVFPNMLVRQLGSSKFQKIEQRYEFMAPGEQRTAEGFLQHVLPGVKAALSETFKKIGCCRVAFVAQCTFEKKQIVEGGVTKTLTTDPRLYLANKDNLTQILDESEVEVAASETFPRDFRYAFEHCRLPSSGWALTRINKLWVNIYKFSPLAGSSYIELPEEIEMKQACVNINNKDQRCFEYSVLYALHAAEIGKNPQRVTKYKKYENELNFQGLEFPVSRKDYERFEKLNKIKIYVFILNNDKVEPYYIGKNTMGYKEVDLLLISDGENNHYVCIKSLSALCSNVTSHHGKKYFCRNCLSHFNNKEKLTEHIGHGCFDHSPARIIFPKKGENYAAFKNIKNQQWAPVVIYADFECTLLDVNEPIGEQTMALQKHVPNSVGAYVASPYPEFRGDYMQWNGKECAKQFLSHLKKVEYQVFDRIRNPKSIIMTEEDQKDFDEAKVCHICKQEFSCSDGDLTYPSQKDTPALQKVRDHDHFDGKFRGAAHHRCNLQYSLKGLHIPVIFHNFKGYDCHLLLRDAGEVGKKLKVIAKNKEQFMCLTLDRLRFIDSCQFLSYSLSELAKNINKYPHLWGGFPDLSDEKKALLTRKGIYPYDFMNDESKFDMKQLPPREAFYSKLERVGVSHEDYQHALNVWTTFQCKSFRDYHNLYLKVDVLLLADIFEDFRRICHENHGIDPCHYVSLPGFSWDAALKMYRKIDGKKDETDIYKPIETFIDIDKLLFVERGMRGGVSVITNRFAKANNPYMKIYDAKKKHSYIIYLDANNLYGYAMSQRLPIGEFSWADPKDFTAEKVLSLGDEEDYGYLFEVDLRYPSELHDLHNDYPLCPEKMACQPSPFMEDMKTQFKLKPARVEKLVPNLNDKKNYVLHYRNLRQALELGMELETVHRVLKFRQEAWLKPFIDFNTKERAKPGKTESEKNMYKLSNNSVFGKTCENVRERSDYRLVNEVEKLLKLQSKPTFKGSLEIGENLRAVEMQKTDIFYNRPIIIGMCILEIAKTLIYDFHYNVIKRKYGDKAKLLFTDTDSLCYHIETEDIYKDMAAESGFFDFSDYPNEHFLFSEANKKVIGKFKDETNGSPIHEFIGLRAKLYCLVTEKYDKKTKETTIETKKTAKGIKKSCISRDLKARHYRKCLLEGVQKSVRFGLIRSKNHQLNTIEVTKSALSSFDDKRWVLSDGVTTYAHGHYKIKT